MDRCAWDQLDPWLEIRRELPIGALLCVIHGPTPGRCWEPSAARKQLHHAAAAAGVRRRFAPHQLRHAHAVEMAHEGVPLVVIQRQLGHANLGITSVYLQEGIDSSEIISTVHGRPSPVISDTAGLLVRRQTGRSAGRPGRPPTDPAAAPPAGEERDCGVGPVETRVRARAGVPWEVGGRRQGGDSDVTGVLALVDEEGARLRRGVGAKEASGTLRSAALARSRWPSAGMSSTRQRKSLPVITIAVVGTVTTTVALRRRDQPWPALGTSPSSPKKSPDRGTLTCSSSCSRCLTVFDRIEVERELVFVDHNVSGVPAL